MASGGESRLGIPGATVKLFDQVTTLLVDTQLTDTSGNYTFRDVEAGTSKLVETQRVNFLDGDEAADNLGGTVDNTQDSNQITDIVVAAGDPDTGGYDFAEIHDSLIQGMVWEDFNNDAEINFGELAIEKVTINLTGTDDRGNPVNESADTDSQGIYMFIDLRPGDYTLNEVQPANYADGLESLGTVNGVLTGEDLVNDQFSQIVLFQPDSEGENYNFGERPQAGSQVTPGQTATIGFWQNKNGQELIESLNGGATATQLGDWLAATFDSMYGEDAGANDLTGFTNIQVAEFYSDLFKRKRKEALQLNIGGPTKVDSQVLALALATYVTNQTLAGTTAESYGFLVTEHGVGTATFNVGDAREAFDVSDYSDLAVLDLLFATNHNSRNGVLYDMDGDGDADDDWEVVLRTLANDVYGAINETGEI